MRNYKSVWGLKEGAHSIQLSQMYFDDEMDLLKSLNDDWSTLLKNIKHREDMHYRLLQSNKAIVGQERSQSDEVEDEISCYQQQLTRTMADNHQLQQEQKQILAKYENNASSSDAVAKLMSRVAANVIEIIELSAQRANKLDHSCQEATKRIKKTIISLVTYNQNFDLQKLICTVLDFSKTKMQDQLFKLEQLTKALKAKEYTRLREIYQPPQKPRVSSVEKIRELMIDRRRDYSQLKQERDSVKKRCLNKMKIKALVSLYSIMLLSKHQWSEEYIGSIEQRKQKVYNDLMQRNRVNHEHIRNFRRLQDQFWQKINEFNENRQQLLNQSPQVNLGPIPQTEIHTAETQNIKQTAKQKQEERITFVNNSCTEVISKKPRPPMAESIVFNEYLTTEAQIYSRAQEDDRMDQDTSIKKKLLNTRTKFALSVAPRENQDFPQIFNKTIYTQNNGSSNKFESIKKESSYQASKGRLPDISRGSSFDNKFSLRIPKPGLLKTSKEDINNMEEDIMRTNKRKDKWFKDDRGAHRTKVSLKNVEVGAEFNNRREQYLSRREQVFGVRERKKTESTGMDSTAYCKRTISKFIDNKLNVFF